jgi:protein NrfD
MMEPGLLKSADWPWLIDLYFFLGGVSGGAFFIATIAHLVDRVRYRDVVRVGYYLAFLTILPGPLLLIIDLGTPSRFLHMLMVPKPTTAIGRAAMTLGPFHIKPFSPMSMGAWGLNVFALASFLAALLTFLEGGRGGRDYSGAKSVIGIVGAVFGFFVAAYPGVLLGATARPLFINARWLGALFLAIGASTGAAAIALTLSIIGRHHTAVLRLAKVTVIALVVELICLAAMIGFGTGSTSAGIRNAFGVLISGSYGVMFWATVVLGLLVPLVLQFTRTSMALASILVLAGGFLIKYVIIAAGQVILS